MPFSFANCSCRSRVSSAYCRQRILFLMQSLEDLGVQIIAAELLERVVQLRMGTVQRPPT